MGSESPKLLIATHNRGKMAEYRHLLRDAPFVLISLDDAGIADEVEETGRTFRENACLKAENYCQRSGLPTLADDSGLEVDALGREPGVRSARYGGDSCRSDADRVSLLLRNLEGVPWERRTARFRCIIALAFPPGHPALSSPGSPAGGGPVVVEGAVSGMIQYRSQGEGGFGYDPVFYLPSCGKTVAQLSLEGKNRISHRADAARKAVEGLRGLPLG